MNAPQGTAPEGRMRRLRRRFRPRTRPRFEGQSFNRLIPNSELYFIDKCGHAPMMEVPAEFNVILERFLQKFPDPTPAV